MDALEALVSIVLIVAGIVISQKKKRQKVQKSVWQQIESALPVQEVPSAPVPPKAPEAPKKDAPAPFPPKERIKVQQSAFEAPFETVRSTEGVDPCHDGMFDDRDEMLPVTAETDASMDQQELIRGFVLSEVLGAPKYKTAGKR